MKGKSETVPNWAATATPSKRSIRRVRALLVVIILLALAHHFDVIGLSGSDSGERYPHKYRSGGPRHRPAHPHPGKNHSEDGHYCGHEHRHGHHDDGEFGVHKLREFVNNTVSTEELRKSIEHYFLAGPHLAAQNEKLANWTSDEFAKRGFEPRTETYNIWTNYPISHRVALLNADGSVKLELPLEEPKLEEDETTTREDRIPTFHGFSASGNATGELVYANLGRRRDYDRLLDEGVDLRNKVVIVRYGGIFRGLKVKFAEELGAKAVLIYSDPAEDGEVTEKNGYKAYPEGPARNPEAVQRGSVQDLSHSPGDPTTPGFPSTPDNEERREEPQGIPGIPSIPISYSDALPLLKALNGHGQVFDDWKGALDGVDYSVGPSKLSVVVENVQDYDFRPNRDVIAVIPGASDEIVLIGNHRDAWIIGGADPNSGSAVLLEVGRVLGKLVESGWQPKRTIVLASWDGEEYGLLGSTEWGEDHAEYLASKAVAYLNVDVGVSGPNWSVSANPLLRPIIEHAAHGVNIGNKSLSEYWGGDRESRIAPLGSGSDYTVFQDYIGIPSMDAGFTAFGGDGKAPVYHYHSNFDSLHWMEKFGDPTFEYHAAVTKFMALAAIDLIDFDQIPFSTVNYARSLRRELKSLLKNYEGPATEEVGVLFGEIYRFIHAAKEFSGWALGINRQLHHVGKGWRSRPKYWWLRFQQRRINKKLQKLDQYFLYEPGLENRPWFKHIVYAPGRYTGYAGQVFPGIAESLEDKDDRRLIKWLNITSEALRAASSSLE